MKQKLTTLPMHIIKQQNGRYRNMKTLEWVSTSQLESKCRKEPVNAELKHERIVSQRWDLNRD